MIYTQISHFTLVGVLKLKLHDIIEEGHMREEKMIYASNLKLERGLLKHYYICKPSLCLIQCWKFMYESSVAYAFCSTLCIHNNLD